MYDIVITKELSKMIAYEIYDQLALDIKKQEEIKMEKTLNQAAKKTNAVKERMYRNGFK